MKTKTPLFRIYRLLVAFAILITLLAPQAHAQLYWNTNGATNLWTGSFWGSAADGPFTGAWSASSDVIFGVPAAGATNRVTLATTTVGNITVNGATVITAGGTLSSKSGGSTITVADGVLLGISGNLNFSTASNNFVWTKAGAGTLNLGTPGNTISAVGNSFTLSEGVLIAGGNNSFGVNPVVNLNGGRFVWNGGRTFANPLAFGGNFGLSNNNANAVVFNGAVNLGSAVRTITNESSQNITFNGVISNSGGLNLTGDGTGIMILTGANTYTGKTTINSGTLRLTNSGRAGATTSDLEVAGGLLDLGNASRTNAVFTLSGGTITNGTLQATSYALQGGTIISNATLGTGTATVTVGTTALNGLLNATIVNVDSGTLNLGSADRLANGAAVTIAGGTLGMSTFSDEVSTFTISSGTLDGSGTLTASSYALQGGTINAVLGAGAITVSSGTTALGSAGRLNSSSALTVNSGQLTLGGNETVASLAGGGGTLALGANAITVGGGNTSTTFSGAITGTDGALTKAGNGVLTLAANTSYTGATTINAGTLVYNGTNTSTAVAVNSGGTLSGSGSVGATTINIGGTMNPGNSPGTQTYASLTWEGGANYNWQLYDAAGVAGTDYDTFVSTGAFTINATSGNKFNINLWTLSGIGPDTNGSALNFSAATSTNWTLGTFGSISGFSADAFAINPFATNGTSGFANIFTGTFSVNTNGSSLLLVYTAPEIGDEFEWSAGAGNWNTAGNWTNNSVPPATGAKIYYSGVGGLSTNDVATEINGLTFNSGAGAYTLVGDALTITSLGIVNNSTALQTVDLNLALGASQAFDAASGELAFGGTVSLDANTLTVTGFEDTTISGAISGTGGLVKTGLGVLTLGGANTYSGGTLISAGGLFGTTTSLQGGITNNFLLAFDQSTNGTYAGVITGTGAVVKAGAGNVTFSGANDYEGGTLVDGGTLTGSTSSVPGDVEVSSGATFAISQTTNGTFSGLIEGAGRFVKDGSGDVTLSGANTYSGGTLVSGGTLTGTAGSLQGNITNNAAVVFVQTPAGTYSGSMSGSGSLTKSGAGTLTLSGANTYAGGTTVSAGTLAGTTGSLQGDIANSGTVRFDQTTTGSYSGELSGGGALVKAGSGAVTLQGANTYTGATTVEGGSLIAANNNSLSSSAVTMNDGSVLAEAGVTLANNFTIGTAASFTTNTFTGLLAGWDFSTNAGGTGNFGPQGMAPASSAEGISIVGLTRGSGVSTTGSGAANAWGGLNFNSANAADAITANKIVTFSFVASNNVTLSITNFGEYNVRRSGTGATTGLWQWSTNGTTFTDIGSEITWGSVTTSAGNAQGAITLDGISGLQDVASGTTVTFRLVNYGGAGTWYLNDPSDTTALDFTVNGAVTSVSGQAGTGTGTLGISEAGSATFSGNVAVNNTATFTAASGGLATFSGIVSGPGTAGITKTGAGTVTLSGSSANTFTGTTTVSAGTLELNKTAGTDALAGNVAVSNGAFLLISQSNQVNNNANVSLSGGTIVRASGVNEVFGDLSLTGSGFLDFGTGDIGTLSFGTYAPSALLTVQNFFEGNVLTFGSDLTGSINNGSLFSFDNGFVSSWNSGTSTFTITAIPEPSTYLAAAGLLSLMLWPSRKRLLKDAKKILGMTPPMRDRLASRRA